MSPVPSLRGRFLWHELLTSDTAAAIDFYTKVVGWKTEAWAQMPDYRMWVGSRGPVGGVMALPEEAKQMGSPPTWMAHIGTPNADATADMAVRLGGKVLKPVEAIPTVGRFVILADPQGVVFSAFTPENPMPMDIEARPGDFCWHELITTDTEAGLRFYTQLFGWEKTDSMDMGPSGTYQMFGWPGVSQGGVYRKPAEMLAPPSWMHYTEVPDVRKVTPRIKELGGMVIMGPHQIPGGGWIVIATDPQGAPFALHEAPPKRAVKTVRTVRTAKTVRTVKTIRAVRAKKPAKKKVVAKKLARKAVRKPAKKAAPKKKAARKPAARKKSAKKRR
jgi:predicted enzyme related to lactoylglutathione lyase